MTHRLTSNARTLSALRWLLMVWVAFCALAFGPTQAFAQDAKKDYVLGAGDVVRINVYQNQDLTLETRINETGTISYPLLGQVRLGGLSVQEAERVIATGLLKGNFLRQPQVSLLVMQVRGNQVSVLGIVNRPGRYPLETSGLRMSDLLATAGGIAMGGADVVTLSGIRDGRPYRVAIDVPTLFTGHSNGQDPLVQNGDTLYVDRQPMVYIFGEVQRPGAMRLERGMTLMQALAAGGGLTLRGTDKGIKVHRRSADGAVRASEPVMTEALQDGDVIQVSASLF